MNTKLSLQEMQLEWDKAHGLYKPTPPTYWDKSYIQLSLSEAENVRQWNNIAHEYWLERPELKFTDVWQLLYGDTEYREDK